MAELRRDTVTKGSAKHGVGGAGDGFLVGAEFRIVLVRFFVCRSFSLPVY